MTNLKGLWISFEKRDSESVKSSASVAGPESTVVGVAGGDFLVGGG